MKTIQAILTVTYDENGCEVEELIAQIYRAIELLPDEGLLSGWMDAEVEEWELRVTEKCSVSEE